LSIIFFDLAATVQQPMYSMEEVHSFLQFCPPKCSTMMSLHYDMRNRQKNRFNFNYPENQAIEPYHLASTHRISSFPNLNKYIR